MSLRFPTLRDDPRQRREWRIVQPIGPYKEGHDGSKASRPPIHPSAPNWDQRSPLIFPYPTPELPVIPPLPWAPLSDDDGVHTAAVDPATIESRREAAAMMADMLEGRRARPIADSPSAPLNANTSLFRPVAQEGDHTTSADVLARPSSRLALALLTGLERRRA